MLLTPFLFLSHQSRKMSLPYVCPWHMVFILPTSETPYKPTEWVSMDVVMKGGGGFQDLITVKNINPQP